jgi:hypothetical protein
MQSSLLEQVCVSNEPVFPDQETLAIRLKEYWEGKRELCKSNIPTYADPMGNTCIVGSFLKEEHTKNLLLNSQTLKGMLNIVENRDSYNYLFEHVSLDYLSICQSIHDSIWMVKKARETVRYLIYHLEKIILLSNEPAKIIFSKLLEDIRGA